MELFQKKDGTPIVARVVTALHWLGVTRASELPPFFFLRERERTF